MTSTSSNATKKRLFHRSIFWPFTRPIPLPAKMQLRYTQHARDAAASDRYGAFQLPLWLPALDAYPFEWNETDMRLTIRLPYDLRHDICLVLSLDTRNRGGEDTATVVTVWLNRTSDTHTTLDRSRYVESSGGGGLQRAG